MSRSARQTKIINIISTMEIETQEELVAQLADAGFDVTQATISRDIKELGLIKTLTPNNKYKYVTKQTMEVKISNKLLNVVKETVLSIVTAENLIVVKTISDSATAVASAIEQLAIPQIVGVIADRSTILIVCASTSDAQLVKEKISQIL